MQDSLDNAETVNYEIIDPSGSKSQVTLTKREYRRLTQQAAKGDSVDEFKKDPLPMQLFKVIMANKGSTAIVCALLGLYSHEGANYLGFIERDVYKPAEIHIERVESIEKTHFIARRTQTPASQ